MCPPAAGMDGGGRTLEAGEDWRRWLGSKRWGSFGGGTGTTNGGRCTSGRHEARGILLLLRRATGATNRPAKAADSSRLSMPQLAALHWLEADENWWQVCGTTR